MSVGSFWFDEATAHLVRAVYRISMPMDVWTEVKDENAIQKADRAARDSASGKITVKIVNSADTAQAVTIDISGVKSVASKGKATVLKAANRTETNTIKDPQHLVPVGEKINGLGTSFTRTFPPCSITVLELNAK